MVPSHVKMIAPVFQALKELGGSGTTLEIYEKVITIMSLDQKTLEEPQKAGEPRTKVQYRLAWARTYLKNYGAIQQSSRGIWTIAAAFSKVSFIDGNEVNEFVHKKAANGGSKTQDDDNLENDGIDLPEEARPWRENLRMVLQNMDPYAFERLTQRLLRECGFEQVSVTKKSGDGGIDGTGKLKLNGIISFNLAFQCKRYQGSVGTGEIRDFRGSMTTDVEKGIFLTTGSFTEAAKAEACTPGKKLIDLINGDDYIDLLVEYGLGVREVKDYLIDKDFFLKV